MSDIRNYSHPDHVIPNCMKWLPNPYEYGSNSFAVDFVTMPKAPLTKRITPLKTEVTTYKAYFKLMTDGNRRFWEFDKFSDNYPAKETK